MKAISIALLLVLSTGCAAGPRAADVRCAEDLEVRLKSTDRAISSVLERVQLLDETRAMTYREFLHSSMTARALIGMNCIHMKYGRSGEGAAAKLEEMVDQLAWAVQEVSDQLDQEIERR